MSNPLYNQMGQNGSNFNTFFQRLNQLKQTVKGNPMDQIQQMLNSGKVTQAQYDQAVRKAQEIMKMMK